MIGESQNAVQRWRSQVQVHHAQSISAQQNFDPHQDFWKGMAEQFRDDPYRKGDALVDRLEEEFRGCKTLVDIGGGAGRLALPLALTRKKVTVADSSRSMLEELRKSCEEAKIQNVEPVFTLWEDAVIQVHEGALCSHVTYGIEDIEKFLQNVNRYASKHVVIVAFMKSPQAHLGILWEVVHGEKRVHLPGVPELMDVLWHMGLTPELSVLDHLGPHIYKSDEDALQDLRKRLYVNQETEKDKNLIRAFQTHLKPTGEGLELVNSNGRTSCIISWDN